MEETILISLHCPVTDELVSEEDLQYVTILKEICYSTYLPNDISCTGNDIIVTCKGVK